MYQNPEVIVTLKYKCRQRGVCLEHYTLADGSCIGQRKVVKIPDQSKAKVKMKIPKTHPSTDFTGVFEKKIKVLNQVYPDDERWFQWSAGGGCGLKFYQMYFLSCVTQLLQPKRIFEFGTHYGRMTVQFAANSPPDCEVYTLDIPESEIKQLKIKLNKERHRSISDFDCLNSLKEIGKAYRETPYEHKVHQLLLNSLDYDETPMKDSVNIVYVDGGHTYKICTSDSEKAINMVKPDGVVFFDDYGRIDEVTRSLNDLHEKYGGFKCAYSDGGYGFHSIIRIAYWLKPSDKDV